MRVGLILPPLSVLELALDRASTISNVVRFIETLSPSLVLTRGANLFELDTCLGLQEKGIPCIAIVASMPGKNDPRRRNRTKITTALEKLTQLRSTHTTKDNAVPLQTLWLTDIAEVLVYLPGDENDSLYKVVETSDKPQYDLTPLFT